MANCIGVSNFIHIGQRTAELWRHIYFSRWQNLLPVAGLVMELVWEGQNLSAYQISMRYLNLRSSYYYFRFRKTNGRNTVILLPVCNLIVYVTLAFCPSWSHKVSSKCEHSRQSYYISIYLKSIMASADILDL